MKSSQPSSSKDNSAQTSDSLYLSRLTFNPKLRETFLNFFVTNFRVVILLIVMIIGWGSFAFMSLPRESDPEVKIPMGVVIAMYPGASPTDVEELVTKKIEKQIGSLQGLTKLTSTSSNSVSSITAEFDPKENLDDALRRLRDSVADVKADLPDEVEDPVIKEVSVNDRPVWTFAITGPYDGLTLHRFAKTVQDSLEKVAGVREVNISGGDEFEFEVALSAGRLATYGVALNQVSAALAAANVLIPAGTFEGTDFNYSVRTDGRVWDAAAIGNIPLLHTANGGLVYVRDVATVRERAIHRTVYSRLSVEGSKPESAVTIDLVKKTGASIIDVTDAAKAIVATTLAKLPSNLKTATVTDDSKEIRKNFDQLTHDFLLTVLLVGTVLFLIVGAKEAFVAGLAIPLVFCASFGVMQLTGITLNFLSLFSLILSLGLLVDDAIVVVSATKQYLRSGKFTPEEAVLLVLNDFKVVLISTTLTTVWAFLPLLMSTGIMGEYIKSIPITVSVTLISSLLIALAINHPLAAVLERIRLTPGFFFSLVGGLALISLLVLAKGDVVGAIIGLIGLAATVALVLAYRRRWRDSFAANAELSAREWRDDELIKKKLREQGHEDHADFWGRLTHGILRFDGLLPIYEKYLRWVLSTSRHRWLTLGVTFALFVSAALLPITGIVKSEFFPVSDFEMVFIDVEGPIGQTLDVTDRTTREIEEHLLKFKEIESFSTVVGKPGAFSGKVSVSSGSTPAYTAGITLHLVDADFRDRTSYDLATAIRDDLASIRSARITVESPRSGPPAGSPFEAQIVGDDLAVLDRVAHELQPILTSIPGVIDPDISLKDSPAEYTFTLNPARLELYGLNAATVGSALRTAITGTEATKVLRDGDETKVQLRFERTQLVTLSDLQNIQLVNRTGQPVFIRDVATVRLTPAVEAITRRDQKRTITLSANLEGTANAVEVLAIFQQKVRDANYVPPAGYAITYGGENEQNQESVTSILRAMIVSAVLIIATLVIQFNSYRKAAIVLVTIPLALIGVFYGLAFFRVALSFPGLIGILALFGIVVKNAIILVDKINLNLRFGIPFLESIVDAGKSRLEAITITSICTIFGILPVTLSNDVWLALGSAVIFGLSLSSFLTLFIVPTLFALVARERETI